MKLLIISLAPFLFIFILFACGVPGGGNKGTVEHLNSPAMKASGLPFSEAVRVGDTIYLSGQIGTVPGTARLIEGGIVEETKQTLENIRDTLRRNGSSLDDVVKCTVFMADISEWPRMNKVYTSYFKPPYPARSAVAGSGLALGARVEIECVAVLR